MISRDYCRNILHYLAEMFPPVEVTEDLADGWFHALGGVDGEALRDAAAWIAANDRFMPRVARVREVMRMQRRRSELALPAGERLPANRDVNMEGVTRLRDLLKADGLEPVEPLPDEGPTCPVCEARHGMRVAAIEGRGWLCQDCNTVFAGSEQEWIASRGQRETWQTTHKEGTPA